MRGACLGENEDEVIHPQLTVKETFWNEMKVTFKTLDVSACPEYSSCPYFAWLLITLS